MADVSRRKDASHWVADALGAEHARKVIIHRLARICQRDEVRLVREPVM